jgi:septum formation protein
VRFSFGKARTRLILASNSPRRAEILRNAGLTFEVYATHADERVCGHESARAHVRRLAARKAHLAAPRALRRNRPAIVIGADTVVEVNREILGKPADVKEARRMLRLLSGRTHRVLTGLCIVRVPDGHKMEHIETTRVRFLKLLSQEIDDYIATGEPFDKAGGYGIQGIGGRFVASIEGCYFNVVGLPLSRVWSMLRTLGYPG